MNPVTAARPASGHAARASSGLLTPARGGDGPQPAWSYVVIPGVASIQNWSATPAHRALPRHGLFCVRCRACAAPAPCDVERWARGKSAEHGSLIYRGHSFLRAGSDTTGGGIRGAQFDWPGPPRRHVSRPGR